MTIEVKDMAELPGAAAQLIKSLGERRIVAFDAAMGAGKTTLIAEMCRSLGALDEASSPTFAIVNQYDVPDALPVYHFDLYRLDDARAVADIGMQEYLESGAWCLIEWPQVAVNFLPDDTAVVHIGVEPDGTRVITLAN